MNDYRTMLQGDPSGFGIRNVRQIVQGLLAPGDWEKLYALLADPEERVAIRAAWALCHAPKRWDPLLARHREKLIEQVLLTQHTTLRRLLLTLLLRIPAAEEPDVAWLDFCLERMAAAGEPPAIRSLCMKLAFGLCRSCPELLHEFTAELEIMEPDLLPPALRSARRNILAALDRQRRRNR